MSRDRKRVLAVALAVALFAVVLPMTFASAVANADNTVRLAMTNGAGTFTYQDGSGATSSQSFTASKQCAPTPAPSSLVTLSADSGAVGFSTHSLGVKAPGEGNSGKCEQVNVPNQVLKLNINNSTAGAPLFGKTFDFAELDIEAKFDAAINIRIFDDGVQVDASPGDDSTRDLLVTCTTSGSDCGPDDSARDNFRVLVPSSGVVPFDEIWLWATSTNTSGAVSLEGGADGTAPLGVNADGSDDPSIDGLGELIGTSDTIFHVSGINCGDEVSASVTGLASVTVTRLENTDQAPCVPKNYVLTTAEEQVGEDLVNVVTFLQEEVDGQENAHYLMTITWTYLPQEPADQPDLNSATVGGRTFYIDYGLGFVPAELCDSVTFVGGSVTSAVHPIGHPWCITGQSYTINSLGEIVLEQHWDGLGDPRMR